MTAFVEAYDPDTGIKNLVPEHFLGEDSPFPHLKAAPSGLSTESAAVAVDLVQTGDLQTPDDESGDSSDGEDAVEDSKTNHPARRGRKTSHTG